MYSFNYVEAWVFRSLFHSPFGVLFTFPSGYWFAASQNNKIQAWGVVPLT